MADSVFVPGSGSTLEVSPDGTTYTKIGQTKDLKSPKTKRGVINITNNDSPDNTKEYAGGMIDPQPVETGLIYKPDEGAAVYALDDGVTRHWRETWPNGDKWEYKGFISEFGQEGKTEDGQIETNFTVQTTGYPTFTVNSGS